MVNNKAFVAVKMLTCPGADSYSPEVDPPELSILTVLKQGSMVETLQYLCYFRCVDVSMNFSAPQILNCEFTTVCVNTYHKNNDDGINTMPIRCLRHGIPRGKALPKVRNYIRIIDKTSWKRVPTIKYHANCKSSVFICIPVAFLPCKIMSFVSFFVICFAMYPA